MPTRFQGVGQIPYDTSCSRWEATAAAPACQRRCRGEVLPDCFQARPRRTPHEETSKEETSGVYFTQYSDDTQHSSVGRYLAILHQDKSSFRSSRQIPHGRAHYFGKLFPACGAETAARGQVTPPVRKSNNTVYQSLPVGWQPSVPIPLVMPAPFRGENSLPPMATKRQ